MTHEPALLGIDLGTQSAKCVVIDAAGKLHGIGQTAYSIQHPQPNWAEQNPKDWWEAVVQAVRQARTNAPQPIAGIGLAGQMHGIVLLDKNLDPLHPAIIWMDRRSAEISAQIMTNTAPDLLRRSAVNRLSPGFAGASLAWLRENEPELLNQTHAVIQPKDYLALRLTGVLGSEHSDASATWLYDIPARDWSEALAEICNVSPTLLPPLSESTRPIGALQAAAAEALGLEPGIPVVAGAADQAALLTGAGVINPGEGAITIGTGGQMTLVSDRPLLDSALRLNTFCHAVPGLWYTMGAILNGGIALHWWSNVLGGVDFTALTEAAAQIPPGAEGVIFLPYLAGERTPHMDPNACGVFYGLTPQHTQAHMTRAVLEGVAFAFLDCLQTLATVGQVPKHWRTGGGGSRGALWRQVLASVLGVELQIMEGEEHTATGAALLAGVGAGVFKDLPQAVEQVVRTGPVEVPDMEAHSVYRTLYGRFRALYWALRNV